MKNCLVNLVSGVSLSDVMKTNFIFSLLNQNCQINDDIKSFSQFFDIKYKLNISVKGSVAHIHV